VGAAAPQVDCNVALYGGMGRGAAAPVRKKYQFLAALPPKTDIFSVCRTKLWTLQQHTMRLTAHHHE
jgi:hypothetical protein